MARGCEGADKCVIKGFCFARKQGEESSPRTQEKERGDLERCGVDLKLGRQRRERSAF